MYIEFEVELTMSTSYASLKVKNCPDVEMYNNYNTRISAVPKHDKRCIRWSYECLQSKPSRYIRNNIKPLTYDDMQLMSKCITTMKDVPGSIPLEKMTRLSHMSSDKNKNYKSSKIIIRCYEPYESWGIILFVTGRTSGLIRGMILHFFYYDYSNNKVNCRGHDYIAKAAVSNMEKPGRVSALAHRLIGTSLRFVGGNEIRQKRHDNIECRSSHPSTDTASKTTHSNRVTSKYYVNEQFNVESTYTADAIIHVRIPHIDTNVYLTVPMYLALKVKGFTLTSAMYWSSICNHMYNSLDNIPDSVDISVLDIMTNICTFQHISTPLRWRDYESTLNTRMSGNIEGILTYYGCKLSREGICSITCFMRKRCSDMLSTECAQSLPDLQAMYMYTLKKSPWIGTPQEC